MKFAITSSVIAPRTDSDLGCGAGTPARVCFGSVDPDHGKIALWNMDSRPIPSGLYVGYEVHDGYNLIVRVFY